MGNEFLMLGNDCVGFKKAQRQANGEQTTQGCANYGFDLKSLIN